MGPKQVKFWFWLVEKLPKKLVYFCALSVVAYATTGKYDKTVVPCLTAMGAIKRYGKDKGIE